MALARRAGSLERGFRLAFQILRRARTAAPVSVRTISSSIQRLSTGAGTGSAPPPPGVTSTIASDVHGGGDPDGAQMLAPVAFATFVMLGGGVDVSCALIV
jgi:hypothetical protein